MRVCSIPGSLVGMGHIVSECATHDRKEWVHRRVLGNLDADASDRLAKLHPEADEQQRAKSTVEGKIRKHLEDMGEGEIGREREGDIWRER